MPECCLAGSLAAPTGPDTAAGPTAFPPATGLPAADPTASGLAAPGMHASLQLIGQAVAGCVAGGHGHPLQSALVQLTMAPTGDSCAGDMVLSVLAASTLAACTHTARALPDARIKIDES